jgi:hypothetical protein
METSKIFLAKIVKRINDGEFDEYITLPFMSQSKLITAVEEKIKKKLEKGATPILSENEIINMIGDMKEASGTAFHLFMKYGFLEATENGYEVSKKGRLALKTSFKM